VVEYYYKARWGFADEFIRLFKKNHFPVLKREIELGHISASRGGASVPRDRGRPLAIASRSCGRTPRRRTNRSQVS